MDESRVRKGHAYVDRASRELKAEKIFRILSGAVAFDSVASVLEIGCGSGFITAWLARALPETRVVGADIEDHRADSSFEFHLVSGIRTQFADETFDVVISNHVIEHVGRANQLGHLQEIRRLLRPSGVAYLATPRRFTFIEPHYRLPMLGWFPAPMNDAYVRSARKGDWYDVDPVTSRTMRVLARAAGLIGKNITHQAFVETLSAEHSSNWPTTAIKATSAAGRVVRPFVPTMAWILSPGDQS